MIDMKCPFCQQELSETIWEYGERETTCFNCDITGNSKLWQELIRTRKVLAIAMDGLKRIEKLTEPSYKNRNLEALALAVNTFSGEIIEQITALKK